MARIFTTMTIDDAFHYTRERRSKIIASYPAHVRQARAWGKPAVGEGAVYPIDDELIMCDPFDVPEHWTEIGGLDFGYDHPTAAVRLVHDPDSGVFYLVQDYAKRKTLPILHVSTLKGWGAHLTFAWGMEGLQTKLSENPEQTQKMFRKHGLKMVDTHATFYNGGVGIERGVQEILELMETGKFKAFRTCRKFFEEKSTYHRKRSNDAAVAQIVKVHDDVLDALRYAYMMFRYATPVRWRSRYGGRPIGGAAQKTMDRRDIFNPRDKR